MLLLCNLQEKAARFALLASVGGHGERKLAVVPVQRRNAEFKKLVLRFQNIAINLNIEIDLKANIKNHR